ncbi:MAG: M15 family metallopeptidase [Pyrinomonadaceae bacterium]
MIKVVERAAEIGPPFIVTEGLRSKERQRELVKKGASRTLNSRHLTGHAVDVADVEATYAPQKMKAIADAFKQASNDCGVKCQYGIDWGWDSPHMQLDTKYYPATGISLTERAAEATKAAIKIAAPARVATAAGAGAAVAASEPEAAKTAVETITQSIPPVPDAITNTVTDLSYWQFTGETLWQFWAWFQGLPLWVSAPLGLSVLWVAFYPQVSRFFIRGLPVAPSLSPSAE